MILAELVAVLDKWFPQALAEEWDNTGLLLGDSAAPVARVMTCLTVTPEVAAEAMEQGADLIVSHHPILFHPIQKLTANGPHGFIYQLAHAGVAVYSPHTAFDSAAGGINEQLAAGLGLSLVQPLRPISLPEQEAPEHALGVGRWGKLAPPLPLGHLANRLAAFLGLDYLEVVGKPARLCQAVAIGCGSAIEFLDDARAVGCDTFVTGEASFHRYLEAQRQNMALLLLGHYASERFAVEQLAERCGQHWPGLQVWASARDENPVVRLTR